MLNENIKYIRKDIEIISIPTQNSSYNRFNPRYWKISTDERYGYPWRNYYEWKFWSTSENIKKEFFTFVFVGDRFPIMWKYKEIYPILKKYKFSKVYTYNKNLDTLHCYFFKRGVLFFENYYEIKDNKDKSLYRLIKLIRLKRN